MSTQTIPCWSHRFEGFIVLRLLRGVAAASLAAVVLVVVPGPPAGGATVANITQQVLAGDNVTLTGPSIINLPSGTTTYRGALSGRGIVTVAGDGTLVLTQDSDFTLPAAMQQQSVTTSGGNWPYPIITDPDQPAVIVDAGATLQYGDGGSTGVIGNYPYTQISSPTLNQDNIEVNGTLVLDITNREYNLGTISGSGTVSQPRSTWGTLDLADDLPFTGTISNGTGMNFGGAAFRLAMPDVAAVDNDGSAIIGARDYTLDIPQSFYETDYGSDINFHTWQAGLIVMTGVDDYTDPSEDTSAVGGSANYRGVNIEGANVQWGNGTTSRFFLPATPQNSYINIHDDGSLAFDYDSPVTLDTPISGGNFTQSLSTPADATVTISPTTGNDVTFATPMNYNGATIIGRGAELLLGTGSAGGDSSLLTGESGDQITDDGTLVIRNTTTATRLEDISGTGALVQAGSATTTLSGPVDYTGATMIRQGTLALGPDASLGSSSGVTLSSAGAALDLNGGTVRNLAGVNGSAVRVAGGALTISTAGTNGYGGSITGGGGVTADGTGTLTLTGRVSMPAAQWRLDQGTLVLGPGATMSVGSLTQQPAETLSIDPGSVITSAGAIRLSGRLALSAPTGHTLPAAITLIHDARPDSITGTFSGLPQGGAITVDGSRYLISYTANGGRDVVLTVAAPALAAGEKTGAGGSANGSRLLGYAIAGGAIVLLAAAAAVVLARRRLA
jgi:autotransporter-associated beta strand protein